MKTHALFVEVLVPLALPKLLTYVLEGVEEPIEEGMRVVVQVGNRKRYTGIVWELHDIPPKGFVPRSIDSVIDDRPVVTLAQRELWQWMAGHYMCTLGEVMSAALPTGLKLSSQSRLVPNPEADLMRISSLDDRARLLYESIVARNGIQLAEAGAILDIKYPQRWVNQLLVNQLVVSEEEWKARYRPKQVHSIQLAEEFQNEEELSQLLDHLERRAPKQARVLNAFLHMADEKGEGWNAVFLESEVVHAAESDTSAIKRMADKGIWLRETKNAQVERRNSGRPAPLPQLSATQKASYNELLVASNSKRNALLHGVTGSGKTEVYIHLIADALERGESVLFLVPEIALTTQLIDRLSHHFEPFLHVYHSRFTRREQTETWLSVLGKKEKAQSPKLLVGARSAIFLPMQKLGLIIVDEEHEPSFKQVDPAPRYHAKDVAIWMSRQSRAFLVLGSATPSVETHWLVENGRMDKVEMNERYGGVMLPEIWCADLKKAHRQHAMTGHFSRLLLQEMESVLKAEKQIILFQNRRGYSPIWQCEICAWMPNCERCDVPLTLHKWKNELNCHHCGFHLDPPPQDCLSCGKSAMKPKGLGTERIEEELGELFPKARVARMDADTTRNKNSHQHMVRSFANREFDILVGTQMVTKGLDFEHVGLVGVLSADRLLNFPDFRNFERAFQMLTQVAGRAGRSGQRGKVILQTFNPDHWVMTKVMANDYLGLVKQELLDRKNYRYPPYVRLIRLTLKHSDEGRLEVAADVLASRLKQRFAGRAIGPETPMIGRINDLYQRVILLKFERELGTSQYKPLLSEDLQAFQNDARFKRIRLTVDVDPV